MLLKIKGRDGSIKDTGLPETRTAKARLTLGRGENKKKHPFAHFSFPRGGSGLDGPGGDRGHAAAVPRWGGALGCGHQPGLDASSH